MGYLHLNLFFCVDIVIEVIKDMPAWPGRHLLEGGDYRRYFGLKTLLRGVVEFECRDQREYEIWTEGVSRLLALSAEKNNRQRIQETQYYQYIFGINVFNGLMHLIFVPLQYMMVFLFFFFFFLQGNDLGRWVQWKKKKRMQDIGNN